MKDLLISLAAGCVAIFFFLAVKGYLPETAWQTAARLEREREAAREEEREFRRQVLCKAKDPKKTLPAGYSLETDGKYFRFCWNGQAAYTRWLAADDAIKHACYVQESKEEEQAALKAKWTQHVPCSP
jgi:hypothetical protein